MQGRNDKPQRKTEAKKSHKAKKNRKKKNEVRMKNYGMKTLRETKEHTEGSSSQKSKNYDRRE